MDLKDLIVIIPEILLLIVPGYISLTIKETFALQKKHEYNETLLYCILYSFIIGIVYSVILALFKLIHFDMVIFLLEKEEIKRIGYICLATLYGYILVKFPESKWGKAVEKQFNESLSPEPNVWHRAMKNSDGAYATVYLNNGYVYKGAIVNYTTDPDEEKREILLAKYCLYISSENITRIEDFMKLIDHSTEENQKVYIPVENIIAIEIDGKEKRLNKGK